MSNPTRAATGFRSLLHPTKLRRCWEVIETWLGLILFHLPYCGVFFSGFRVLDSGYLIFGLNFLLKYMGI